MPKTNFNGIWVSESSVLSFEGFSLLVVVSPAF